jgi:phosphonate transport system permease protein
VIRLTDEQWERIRDPEENIAVEGLGHGGRFISRMFPPTFAADKLPLLQHGMLESLQIAILATLFGIALSLPLGLAAARNMSPAPLAWTARSAIALLRSFHPVIVAILFIKAVGFGVLAGVLAIVVTSFGFLSKRWKKCRCSRWKRCARPAHRSSQSSS